MKNILLALRDIVALIAIVASGLFTISAVALFSVVLSMLTSKLWLLSYGAYVVILWVIYKIVF